jgi:DNA invertase Pin-like site-specific DNA recombinase
MSASTSSIMMALLIERITALESQVQNISAPSQAQAPIVPPVVSSVVTPAESSPNPIGASKVVEKVDEKSVEGVELQKRLMNIGNSEQVAILARVSTPGQKASNRESLSNQVAACTEQMKQMGCKNAHLIRQIDESASHDGQQLEEFFSTIKQFKKHPVVFVRTVSRFGRQVKLGMERLRDIQNIGGRVIFGIPENDQLVWYDTSSQSGLAKFESQLLFAQQWTQEMSITARDNAKRKQKDTNMNSDEREQKRICRQDEALEEAVQANDRDSHDLRRIIEWIRIARRGGPASEILGGLKGLIDWNLWKTHPKYKVYRLEPWIFDNEATKNPKFAQKNELTCEWIAINLREWRVRVPPVKGLASIRSRWTADLVQRMLDADGSSELTKMIAQL